ncbi:Eco57I restriction-modification methylase domain-containing protein [Glaciibacter psychrotolerans]
MDSIASLLARTEGRRTQSLASLDEDSQAALGQFFTPGIAADLIASMVQLPASGTLRVLDPGAGSGSLTAAIAARIFREAPAVKLELVAVELDESVCGVLRETLDDIRATGTELGVEVSTGLVTVDFIEEAASLGADFGLVIMNPPYAKIPAGSPHRKAMARHGVEAPNLYAAFLALGAIALKPGGQLVAITPRSFANGPYFAQFRGFLLDRVSLSRIHVFESRKTVFSDTGVLQENIIIAGTRDGIANTVTLSASTGHEDEVTERVVPADVIVHPGDLHRFVRIPSAAGADDATSIMQSLPATLEDLGVKVSTGRVVDFRSRDNLVSEPDGGTYPMVYPANIKSGIAIHPMPIGKPQWFQFVEPKDEKLLVPAGAYVIIKRFSAKEERRRIVAGVWSDSTTPAAFDNKTNYVHSNGTGLDMRLATGLNIWLNSTLVDTYFRVFSGHTQVNATDLRSMLFPSAAALRSLGRDEPFELPTQGEIDRMVTELLDTEMVA